MPSILVSDLHVSYKKLEDTIPLIRNISFELSEGDVLLVVGLNGAGKSTLIQTITGIIPNALDSYVVKGDIFVGDTKIDKTYCPFTNGTIFITQNPQNQFLGLSVYQELQSLLSHLKNPTDKSISEFAKEIHLDAQLNSSIFELSMGQKQMLVLSTLFLAHGNILLLDEPTSFLDKTMTEWLMNLVHKAKERKATIIINTHTPRLFSTLATNVLALQKGEVIFFKDISDVTNDDYLELYHIPDKTVKII